MGVYDANIKRFAGGLIPVRLRGGTLERYVLLLSGAFDVIRAKVCQTREEGNERMSYNAQVFSMEKMLNNRMRPELERISPTARITVTDYYMINGVYVYRRQEQNPLMIGCEDITSWSVWGYIPFAVLVPSALEGDEDVYNRIYSLVNEYKFCGTNFYIKYV